METHTWPTRPRIAPLQSNRLGSEYPRGPAAMRHQVFHDHLGKNLNRAYREVEACLQ